MILFIYLFIVLKKKSHYSLSAKVLGFENDFFHSLYTNQALQVLLFKVKSVF